MSPAAKRRFALANSTAPTAEPAGAAAPQAAPPVPAPVRAAAAPQEEVEAEAAKPKWDARMSLTLSKGQKRALDLARVDDGIDGTARIRAMIALWETDERLRRRVDREARNYR
jgi:hypothetical protein